MNKDGVQTTDEKGALIMREGAKVDLSTPAKIEVWRHGDIGDAEGLSKKDVWKKKKVFAHV